MKLKDERNAFEFERYLKMNQYTPLENDLSKRQQKFCYCDLWDKNQKVLEDQGVPRGYCSFCQKCKKPGHTRHFPGAVPYTGGWCDYHYSLLKWLHPLGSIGVIIWTVAISGLLLVWKLMR